MPTSEDSARVALDVALRHGLPYTALRDFEPDPRLFHYVRSPTPSSTGSCRCSWSATR